ncbi:MAG: hypothetical protein RIS48_2406 [Pseudomonadota bacterium]
MYLRTRLPDNKRVYLLAKGVAASCTRASQAPLSASVWRWLPRFSSLQETMSAFLEERVLTVHHWTDRLFSFTTTRDPALRFSNGHFTMIGLKVDGKPLLRAYSIASPNWEEHLEFLSIKVPDGPLTSKLQNIQVGDTIIVGKKPTGTLLIDYLLPGKNLYLIGTGTGLAPWLSIVRDPDTYEKFKVGMAGYTFVNFDLDKTLQTLEKCDVHYLCIKDFHLPFNSTDQQIADFHEKLKSKGVTGYAVGPIYMKTEQEIDNAFEYAKRVGVKLIVGVPNYDLLPYLDKKVKEYDFNYAIHLHGPDMPLYPDADDVWENVKDLDPRIGMCLDIGHDRRNGKDPVADLEKYMREAVVASPERPVLVDHYLIGQELEVDAICDGETVLIPGIMEHIERAGVHSGDSIAVYPPQNLSAELIQTIEDYTIRVAQGLNTIGLVNIQFVISNVMKELDPAMFTKSGIMVGLGEERNEDERNREDAMEHAHGLGELTAQKDRAA